MKPYRVSGISMWPVLQAGDLVLTAEKDRLEGGDLVVRTVGGETTVHRYFEPGRTKGDWVKDFDAPEDFTNAGHLVVGLVMRPAVTFFRPTGPSKIMKVRHDSLSARQTWLSRLLNRSSWPPARMAVRLALLGNGLVLRWSFHYRRRESLDVVPGS